MLAGASIAAEAGNGDKGNNALVMHWCGTEPCIGTATAGESRKQY